MTNPPQVPECDRLSEVAPYSQKIGEFLDWCRAEKGWLLAGLTDEGDIGPVIYSVTKVLAEFFRIDLDKVEEERRSILEYIRAESP